MDKCVAWEARARRRSGGVSPPPSTFPSYYRPLRPSSAPVVIDNQDGRPAVSLPACLSGQWPRQTSDDGRARSHFHCKRVLCCNNRGMNNVPVV